MFRCQLCATVTPPNTSADLAAACLSRAKITGAEYLVPKLPRISGRELLRALQRDGWYEIRVRGSHHRLAHPDHAQKITVAVHAGDTVKAGTLQGILDDAGMPVERLIELL